MNRRQFLSAVLAASVAFPSLADQGKSQEQQPSPLEVLVKAAKSRELWLHRAATQEDFKFVYYKDGNYLKDGYVQACTALRDQREKPGHQVVQMDLQLLDLLFGVQEWLRINATHRQIHIISGYRSPRTNASLEGTAKNSMHMYARAADIRIPGLPTTYLGKLGTAFQIGGVGQYSQDDFVHLDTGRIRSWSQ